MDALIHSARAGVFASLADPAMFARASVSYGAVTWPNGVDMAPDAMHDVIEAAGEYMPS